MLKMLTSSAHMNVKLCIRFRPASTVDVGLSHSSAKNSVGKTTIFSINSLPLHLFSSSIVTLKREWVAFIAKVNGAKITNFLGVPPSNQGWFLGELRGQSPLLKISAHFGGSAPLKFLHWLRFSELIGLASNVLWPIVHCYRVIEAFLIVDYTIILYQYWTKLSCFQLWKYGRGCSWVTPKLWAWLCLGHPLLTFLEITTTLYPSFLGP